MKNKPIIGIVSRPIKTSSNKNMLGVYENYIRCVIKSGGIPLIIAPPANMEYENYNIHVELKEIEKEDLLMILNLCEGIILPGGENAFKYDYYIIDYCINNDLPVLGICLGMQAMCEYSSDKKITKVYNHYLTNHKITIDHKSHIYNIFKKNIMYVNSRHNCHASDAGEYRIIARSDDEVIEAVQLDSNTFNLGVEWHPEDLTDNLSLFQYFINIIKNKS